MIHQIHQSIIFALKLIINTLTAFVYLLQLVPQVSLVLHYLSIDLLRSRSERQNTNRLFHVWIFGLCRERTKRGDHTLLNYSVYVPLDHL